MFVGLAPCEPSLSHYACDQEGPNPAGRKLKENIPDKKSRVLDRVETQVVFCHRDPEGFDSLDDRAIIKQVDDCLRPPAEGAGSLILEKSDSIRCREGIVDRSDHGPNLEVLSFLNESPVFVQLFNRPNRGEGVWGGRWWWCEIWKRWGGALPAGFGLNFLGRFFLGMKMRG